MDFVLLVAEFFHVLVCIIVGIVIYHYFSDVIPFDTVFEKTGTFIKKCAAGFSNALKRLASLVYRNRAAIAGTAVRFAREAKKFITDEDIRECQPDYVFLLIRDDILIITKWLSGHPYDTPVLVNCFQAGGVSWYDFRAVRLARQYQDLDRLSLKKMLLHILQKYFLETRGVAAVIYIEIATDTRCYFGIALSAYGERQLEEKYRKAAAADVRKPAPPALEEEIDLSPGPEDGG